MVVSACRQVLPQHRCCGDAALGLGWQGQQRPGSQSAEETWAQPFLQALELASGAA